MKKPIEQEIVTVLSTTREKLNYKQIAAKLNIFDKKGRAEVKSAIDKLVHSKIIIQTSRGKYRLNAKYLNKESTGRDFVVGPLEVKYNGSAYVLREGDKEDIFIAERNLSNALHNDIVKVLLFPARKNKKAEGEVVEVIERSQKQLVGTIRINRGVAYFVADSAAYHRDIIIPGRLLKRAKNGEKVIIKIIDWTQGSRNPIGEVTQVLGMPGNNDVEMQSILAEFDFPLQFPTEVEAEAAAIETTISDTDLKKRKDCRNVNTFTIDPEDAKDFDDALSYETLPNGLHRVGVHIADVSHYVTPGTLLDKEAYERGTSVYLVDRTIPMLPEVLSNNLCSLRPNEDKLCFSAIFDLDDNGKVMKEWFGRTVIHSNARLTYAEAQKIIDTGEGTLAFEILQLNQLAGKLRKKRFDNNAINFEKEEIKFQLDENAKPIGVFIKKSGEANFLIEEFMLLANKKVAEKIGRERSRMHEPKTFVYRVHAQPLDEKLQVFKSFVRKLGYEFKTGSPKALANSFNNMFTMAKGKQEYDMLSKLSIRTMARAAYSTENIGHYGLAFPYYTHFTSPIRRYPDLLVHRLLQAYLDKDSSRDRDEYETYCKHCSQMEQKATEAERTSIKYKQAEFLADKIGKDFDATISGISKWGVFAELVDSKCEGLIPMRKFDDDFYYIDEENYTLVGLHKGNNYRFGDKIRVRIVEVNIAKRQINLELA